MDKRSALALRTGGLVLAGGRSSRFGAEKAVAPFSGRVMMDAALDCLAPLALRAVSARAGSAAEAHARVLSLAVLHDAADAPPGPLAGVAAGLAWAKAANLAVLATAPCDAPLLPKNLFPLLLAGLGHAPAAFVVAEGREHPLCAVWRVERVDIAAALAGGQHPPVRTFLAEVGARRVHFNDTRAFTNANTPDTLQALEDAA